MGRREKESQMATTTEAAAELPSGATAVDRQSLIVTFLGAMGGEGASTTALNVAASIAKELADSTPTRPGRVLLIDGDATRGTLALRVAGRLNPSMFDLIEFLDQRKKEGLARETSWPQSYDEVETNNPSARAALDAPAYERLWYPELVDEIVSQAEGRLKDGRTMTQQRREQGFYEPVCLLQEKYPKPDLIRFALQETAKKRIADKDSNSTWHRYTEAICRNNGRDSVKRKDHFRQFVHVHEALGNLDLLAACTDLDLFFDLRRADFEEVLAVASRFYEVIVISSGPEVVHPATRVWLENSHRTYLVTIPELGRYWASRRLRRTLTHSRPDPSDRSTDPLLMPPLVLPTNLRMILNKANMRSGFDVRGDTEWQGIDKKLRFEISDHGSQLTSESNADGISALSNKSYGKEIWRIAADALNAMAEASKSQTPWRRLPEFKQEMERWIVTNGSKHLKETADEGFPLVGAYLKERAAAEFPSFLLAPFKLKLQTTDEQRILNWVSRANPTEDALTLLRQTEQQIEQLGEERNYKAEVVFLKDNRYENEHLTGEAVIVSGYLGRDDYVLVHRLDLREAVVRFTRRLAALTMRTELLVDALPVVIDSEENEQLKLILKAALRAADNEETNYSKTKIGEAFVEQLASLAPSSCSPFYLEMMRRISRASYGIDRDQLFEGLLQAL